MKNKIMDSTPLPKGQRCVLEDDDRLKGDGLIMGGPDLSIWFERDKILVTTIKDKKWKHTVEVPNPLPDSCWMKSRDEGPWFRCMSRVAWVGKGPHGHKYKLCTFHKREMETDPRIVEWRRMPKFGEWGKTLPFEKDGKSSPKGPKVATLDRR
jgi:hypothetical protein